MSNGDDDRSGHPPGGSWWRRLLAGFGIGRGSACDRPLTPDEDLQIAFRASADGELEHAAFHVACVLKADPTDRRALGLLDRMIGKCRDGGTDPLALAPLKRDNYAGTVGVRAYVLFKLGRHAEAVELLRQVAHADPQTPWWQWAAEWLRDPAVAAAAGPDHAAGMFAKTVLGAGDDAARDPDARGRLDAILPALEAVAAAHPAHEAARYLYISAIRKLGRTDEAVRLAEAFRAERAAYMPALCVATARDAAGDVDGAVAAYRDALAFNPGDAPTRADVAELLADAGRFREALEWADDAVAHDAAKETSAAALALLLRHRMSGDRDALEQYHRLVSEQPNRRMRSRAMSRLGPFTSFLRGPSEATINLVRGLVEEHGDLRGGKMKLTRVGVSSIEAPSSRLAVERTLGLPRGEITFEVGDVPEPDPRVPRGAVDWLLWRYDDNDPSPALPAPSADVSTAVAGLAATPYDLDVWAERARELVAVLRDREPDAERLAGELLATMVHPSPPPAPEAWTDWDWIRHVQVAAALAAAAVDGGWAGSVRRRAMIALVRGPVDWTTEAGIVALTSVFADAALDDAARAEAVDLLRELAASLPSVGYCCYDETLAWAVARVSDGTVPPGFETLWRRLSEE